MTTILPEGLYEAAEAAALLHVTRRGLRRLPIPCSRLTARTVLYRGQDLLVHLERTRVGDLPWLRRIG